MEDLKFPEGNIPQDKPRGLSMDAYLEFVLFNRKNFPCPRDGRMPAPVRFVICEDDASYGSSPSKS
ncbi:MAG: hypothetical protein V1882_01345 [Candidatus Omnitrophota bacterium]